MPQMAPLNWIILFIMLILLWSIFNSMNYFNYNPPHSLSKNSQQKKYKTNWKW